MVEINEALIYMSNGKTMRPGELPAELVKLGLSDSYHGILLAFHARHHCGCVDDEGSTARVERRHHQSSTQEERPD